MEYLRWLEPCMQLHQMLQEEYQRNPTTAIDETQARILMATFGRDRMKMVSILTTIARLYGREMPSFLFRLEAMIEYKFANLFDQNVTELPDSIGCPLMDLRAIPHENGYQLDPDIPYRRGEMPCHIVEFLQNHRVQLEALAPALRDGYPKMAEACERVLAKPTDAQGNICKTLGDVIIALGHSTKIITQDSFS